jgi:hypothetical protein
MGLFWPEAQHDRLGQIAKAARLAHAEDTVTARFTLAGQRGGTLAAGDTAV